MKTHKLICLFVLCLISILGHAQIQDTINIYFDDVKSNKIDKFDKIHWQSDYQMHEIGKPELPVYRVSYILPIDAKISRVTFRSKEKQVFKKNIYIYPTQPQLPVGYSGDIKFVEPDQQVYAKDLPYPNKLYDIESDDILQGYRVVTVRFYPFEYIPKSRILNYYPNLEYTIEYESREKEVSQSATQSVLRAELCKKFIKNMVRNPNDVDVFGSNTQSLSNGKNRIQKHTNGLRAQSISVLDEIVPDYIIITTDSFKSAFHSFIEWKTKKGIFTIIKTVEEIYTDCQGSDLQEKIRNYLLYAYQQWGAGLYVLLGGDIRIVPSRMVDGVSDNSFYPTDKYFSTSAAWSIYNGSVFNGNNTASYINTLGRIPASNAQEAIAYLNKVITYEKANNLGDLNYLKNNLYADAYLEYNSAGNLINFFHSNIKNYVSTYVPAGIHTKYICDNADCSGTSRYGTSGSDCSNGHTNGDLELNRNTFLSCLNTGANLGVGKFHFIYHLDHSSATSIGLSSRDKGQSVNKGDMDNLTNGTAYQILLSDGCHPANFQYDCFGKHYILNPNDGGIAFLGNTDVGWQGEEYHVRDFSDAIYSTSGHPSFGQYDIGSAFQNVCMKTHYDKWRLHLLGDPEMQVWTDTPSTFNVTVSTSISASTSAINVSVSGLNLPTGEKARICVQKGKEVYETSDITTNGTYTIPLTLETAGTLNVTVTAHNYFPVEKTVTVNTSTAPNPVISSINFIDDGTSSSIGNSIGNGNGQNDAGETIRLQVALKNTGINTANSLTAVLSCNSDSITVLNNSASVSNLASGTSITKEFRYKIAAGMCETLSNAECPIQFQLLLTDAASNEWTKTFNIDVFATDLKQRNKLIVNTSNGDMIIAANETVTFNIELQNTGQAPAKGLTAKLISNNAANIVSSCSATLRNYPAIGRFETKTATTNFQFTTGSTYTANTILNFTLEVTDAYGKKWEFKNFSLTKPATVTNLNFTAAETEIDLTWTPLSNVGGYNIYRCNVGANDTESGNYVKLNQEPVTFPFFNDREELQQLTKYHYQVKAVSTTGMEGDATHILAWTSYPTKGEFPVEMESSSLINMISSIQAEDVNLDGRKEIFTAATSGDAGQAGWLIALDAEGVELFDIDNNLTSKSGFARFDAAINANVAIGDLHGTGEYQVVSVTRDQNNSTVRHNYITSHAVKDNNGDSKPDVLWQKNTTSFYGRGAVLANVDNSPDGSKEVIIREDGAAKIQILDADGNLLNEFGQSNTYGVAVAVADLDNDGDLEIIAGYSEGVYIWHHNGTPYSVYTNSNYNFHSSPVVCDLDNDGQKEIVIVALSKTSNLGVVHAFNYDGTLIWTSATFPISDKTLSNEVVVGDLDNDNGYLKIVSIGANLVNVWDYLGTLISSTPLSGVSGRSKAPILADVDGNSDVEIIINSSEGKIYAIKPDGSNVLGFPLRTDPGYGASVCVADLDNNGKNEVIAGAGNKKVYVWETVRDPSLTEWGCRRYDSQNTGEYHKICAPVIISSNTTWSSNNSICGNIIVKSGTLTLDNHCDITMDNSSMIVVMAGATLNMDSGHLLNCNVKVLEGGHLILQNNAVIQKRSHAEFNVMQGATFDYQMGSIE